MDPQWFSDPNLSNSTPSIRPLTSYGFDLPLSLHISARKSTFFGLSTLEGEPRLLEELEIDFGKILEKTKSVCVPTKTLNERLMADGDVAGPFVFCTLLGVALTLAGKMHFGYVFGFGVVGCMAMYAVLNLMTSKEGGVKLHVVFSVLGYALLPIVVLAVVAIFVPWMSGTMAVPCVGWCTLIATRFFEAALQARDQRYLIAYPTFLLFACFALITVF